MYTEGINPQLDFSDIYSIIQTVEECNEIKVHPRHPYAGELVFTAFSGSHQDAIKKGFAAREKKGDDSIWSMPYLPIDPADIGCNYEAVIRVNSQSGKGGVAYLVQQALSLDLPRRMQVAFYQVVQEVADRTGKEMTAEDIERTFRTAYSLGKGYQGQYTLVDYALDTSAQEDSNGKKIRLFSGKITDNGTPQTIKGSGNGPISSILDALKKYANVDLSVREYHEHAIGTGSDTRAASYVELTQPGAGPKDAGVWGVGVDEDVTAASLKAVLSAVTASVRSSEELEASVDQAVVGADSAVDKVQVNGSK